MKHPNKCLFSVILPPREDGMPVPPLSLSLSSHFSLSRISQRVTAAVGTADWSLISTSGAVVDMDRVVAEIGYLPGRENMTILQVYVKRSIPPAGLTGEQFSRVNIELNEAMTHLGVLRSRVDTQADRNRELENKLQTRMQNDVRPSIAALIEKYKHRTPSQTQPTQQQQVQHIAARLL
eukprot:TRINITY_DN12486_c0_g1_i1.p1 TRINITY_DN12486_c0_g1~~TRINITY_DN12486_c0_g1_i1.p1  ORF type:complete len:179 (+),score=23.21 TRINITY_DN12486_c0_g1_i1:51-587(+)